MLIIIELFPVNQDDDWAKQKQLEVVIIRCFSLHFRTTKMMRERAVQTKRWVVPTK